MSALSAAIVLAIHQLDIARRVLQDVLTLSTDIEGEARLVRNTLPLSITEGERQILVLLGEGRSNKEIAARLAVAESTVKNRMVHIFRKLQVQDRVQAALLAHDLELVPELAPHVKAVVRQPRAVSPRLGPRSRLGPNPNAPRRRSTEKP